MFELCRRTPLDMENATCSDQYVWVKKRVDELEYRKNDSPLITRAINDVRFYMKTLAGDFSLRRKDRFSIRVNILRERLTDIDLLVRAILEAKENPDRQFDLTESYRNLKNNIRYGFFRVSNLKYILDTTSKKFGTEFILEIPDKFLCAITCQIMQDPVVATDGFTYERAAIEEWIKKGRQTYGHAISPRDPEREVILGDNLIENRGMKLEITTFLKKYPNLKNEASVDLEETSSDEKVVIKLLNPNSANTSSSADIDVFASAYSVKI